MATRLHEKPVRPIVFIVGPTASGKTALAIKLALELGGEIIAADSRTIYKGMDIGTAKPTKEEQAVVPHFGLDVVEPGERFTAADFKAYAVQKIDEIHGRGHVPFIVGGTGLYVDSVLFDYQFGAEPDPGLRAELEHKSVTELQDYCKNNNIELPENSLSKRYLIRQIEQQGSNTNRRDTPVEGAIVVGIATDVEQLKERIQTRSEQLFEHGMVEEAKMLGKKYGWESEAMTANIYRLVHEFEQSEMTEDALRERFAIADWQLAKRQLTWLKRNSFIHWLGLTDTYDFVLQSLGKESIQKNTKKKEGESRMIDALFGSKTRVKLLHLFLNHPGQSFYVREITRLIDEQINSVRRELANMLEIGVITSDSADNKLYYEVNQRYGYYLALRAIFANEPIDAPKPARAEEQPSEQYGEIIKEISPNALRLAIVAGVLVRGSSSPLDVLLVGNPPQQKVKNAIQTIEKLEGRELNYSVLPYEEFYYRLSIRDKFIMQVVNGKHSVIIDKENVLTQS